MVHHEWEFVQIRNSILLRDNHICQFCGAKPCKEVHHIDGNRANNKAENLLAACRKCNNKRRKPRREFESFRPLTLGRLTTTQDGKRDYQKEYMRLRRQGINGRGKISWIVRKPRNLVTTTKEGKRAYMRDYMRFRRAKFESAKMHPIP